MAEIDWREVAADERRPSTADGARRCSPERRLREGDSCGGGGGFAQAKSRCSPEGKRRRREGEYEQNMDKEAKDFRPECEKKQGVFCKVQLNGWGAIPPLIWCVRSRSDGSQTKFADLHLNTVFT